MASLIRYEVSTSGGALLAQLLLLGIALPLPPRLAQHSAHSMHAVDLAQHGAMDDETLYLLPCIVVDRGAPPEPVLTLQREARDHAEITLQREAREPPLVCSLRVDNPHSAAAAATGAAAAATAATATTAPTQANAVSSAVHGPLALLPEALWSCLVCRLISASELVSSRASPPPQLSSSWVQLAFGPSFVELRRLPNKTIRVAIWGEPSAPLAQIAGAQIAGAHIAGAQMAQIVGATAASVLQAGARMAARVSATEVEPLYDSEGGVIVGAAEARPAAPPLVPSLIVPLHGRVGAAPMFKSWREMHSLLRDHRPVPDNSTGLPLARAALYPWAETPELRHATIQAPPDVYLAYRAQADAQLVALLLSLLSLCTVGRSAVLSTAGGAERTLHVYADLNRCMQPMSPLGGRAAEEAKEAEEAPNAHLASSTERVAESLLSAEGRRREGGRRGEHLHAKGRRGPMVQSTVESTVEPAPLTSGAVAASLFAPSRLPATVTERCHAQLDALCAAPLCVPVVTPGALAPLSALDPGQGLDWCDHLLMTSDDLR